MAPCRLALKTKTSCPSCCRPMSIKTLKYQHVCGRTWDVAKRAAEEEHKARSQMTSMAERGCRNQRTPPYLRKSIKSHEVPRDKPTLRCRFVKCMCETSCSLNRPGKVLDWHEL